MSASVRTYSRRGRSGRMVRVRRHDRSTRGMTWSQMQNRRRRRRGRRGVQLGRGFRHLGRAFKLARRNKTATAALVGVAGLVEVGAWVGLRGVAAVGVTAAVLAAMIVLPVAWSVSRTSGGGQR